MAITVQWVMAVGLLVCAGAMVANAVLLARLYLKVRRERIETERSLDYQPDWARLGRILRR